jgi:hypothetical protein
VNAEAALSSCSASLVEMERVARRTGDPEAAADVTNRYGWLADAYRAAGDLDRAWSARTRQERLLKELVARDPRNMDVRDRWLTSQFMMAELEIDRKRTGSARRRLLEASRTARAMTDLDPANREWRRWSVRIRDDLARLEAIPAGP